MRFPVSNLIEDKAAMKIPSTYYFYYAIIETVFCTVTPKILICIL